MTGAIAFKRFTLNSARLETGEVFGFKLLVFEVEAHNQRRENSGKKEETENIRGGITYEVHDRRVAELGDKDVVGTSGID